MPATFRRALLSLVFALPVLAQHPNVARGFQADKIYRFDGVDTVNVYNGNLSLMVPIGPQYTGNGMLKYRFILVYNSKAWDQRIDTYRQCEPDMHDCQVDYSNQAYVKGMPSRRSNAGMGWLLSLGRLISPSDPILDPGNSSGEELFWTYESPDGADHHFFGSAGVWHTSDGSFLRLEDCAVSTCVQAGAGAYEVEFPDGMIHTFRSYAGEPSPRLEEIRDRFGNRLEVDCPPGADCTFEERTKTGALVRTHHARLRELEGADAPADYDYDNYDFVIDRIELAAFNGTTATYSFEYTTDVVPYGCYADMRWPETPDPKVPRLRDVILPDQSRWTFSYGGTGSPVCSSLTKAVLPTRGEIVWEYGQWWMPTAGCHAPLVIGSDTVQEPFSSSEGVKKKTTSLPGQTATSIWTYQQAMELMSSPTYTCQEVQQANLKFQQSRVTVTLPGSTGKTEHFFSIWPFIRGTLNSVFDKSEFGLPFTRDKGTSSGGKCLMTDDPPALCLSTIHYDADGVAKRWTYVQYDGDHRDPNSDGQQYRREAVSRTYFETDGGPFLETRRSRYDGLGHFREVKTSDSWSGLEKIETTNFNPGKEDVIVDPLTWANTPSNNRPSASQKWLLSLFDSTSVSGDDTTVKSELCFDAATGFLKRQRTLAGASAAPKDLLVVFDPDGLGNIATERHFGGDEVPLPANFETCTATPPAPDYEILHTYSGGTRKTSKYDGVTFYSLDLAIDGNTGLPNASRDTTGLETEYEFNAMGRLVAARPPEEARTSYSYSNATATVPAGVAVQQFPNGAAAAGTTPLTDRRIYFDGFGRPIQHRMRMPDNWSVTNTTYDPLGRIATTSMPEYRSGSGYEVFTPLAVTTNTYDVFGRPLSVRNPDDKTTTFAHTGVSKTVRSAALAMAAGDTTVSITEKYDGLGRLVSVRESSCEPEASCSSGWVESTYGYNAGDRLAKVTIQNFDGSTQPSREFNYDGRGFLTSETHPESGTTTYLYDAKGHVTKRDTPAADLEFVYDKAERLLLVEQGASVIKELVYGTTALSLGKLDHSVRHNVQPFGDIQVKETYSYGGMGGRLSSKRTEVSSVGVFTGATFADEYTYDSLGALETVTYPQCEDCTGLSEPERTVSHGYDQGILESVTDYADPILYHPNGLVRSIRHKSLTLNNSIMNGPLYEQTLANGMARPETISVSNFCANFSVTAQPASQSTPSDQAVTLSVVVTSGATTYQWYEGENTLIPGATSSSLTRSPTVTTKYWVRTSNGSCTVDSQAATVTVTSCPEPVIMGVTTIKASGSGQASITPVEHASYSWAISGGTIIPPSNESSVTYRAGCTGSVTLTVTVDSCGSDSHVVNISPIVIVLNGSAEGASTTLTAQLDGTPPWTVTWSHGPVQSGVMTTSVSQSVTPAQTTTYTATITDAYTCSKTSAPVTVTVLPPAPTSVSAFATASDRVLVTWAYSGSADSFAIDRFDRMPGSPSGYREVGTVGGTATSWTNLGLPANTACLYRVRAVKAGTSSDPSGFDLATTTMFPENIVGGVTAVKASHLMELRTAVNAVRALVPLGNATFTDPSPAGLLIRGVHISELRSALDAARSALVLPPVIHENQPLPANHPIRAVHVTGLREGVQ